MTEGINVLSLFDGISCGQIALERTNIKINNYFASEIDKNAIKITQKNYPNTIQLGDITKWKEWNLPKIDLIIAGSPCQGFSYSGKKLNFEDPRSKLFFEFLNILRTYKPKYFLLENVKMKREWRDIITINLQTLPIYINSNVCSAQNRGRLYWTNINFKRYWKDKILLKDILSPYYDNEEISNEEIQKQLNNILSTSKYAKTFKWRKNKKKRILVLRPDNYKIQRIGCISFGSHCSEIITATTQPHIFDGKEIRKINFIEAERLQTLPDNYTEGISDTNRYKVIGNGWTVNVITRIFEGMK